MDIKTAARLAELHTALAAVYADLAKQNPAGSDSERMVGLAEAATRLGVTVSWLCRRSNWQRVGGFKGPDRRVKFPLSAIATFAKARKQ